MPAPARFLFDTDFAAPPPKPEPVVPPIPTITVPDHQALLAEAEERAYRRGLAEGREAAEARAAGRLADEAARLASAAQSIGAVLDVERARIEADATRLAEIIARRLAGRLLDLHPQEAILAVVADAMEPLRKAPHLVLRLAAGDAEPIRTALDRVCQERGFAGRLVVLGEDGLARGDCRLEWADGGMVFDRASVEAAVLRAVDAHILALTGSTTAPNERAAAEMADEHQTGETGARRAVGGRS